VVGIVVETEAKIPIDLLCPVETAHCDVTTTQRANINCTNPAVT
jgi:hypothetical protein